MTGNTVIDVFHLEVAKPNHAITKREIDLELGAHSPADWRATRFVLITGYRRENFGDGFASICEAITLLAAEQLPAPKNTDNSSRRSGTTIERLLIADY